MATENPARDERQPNAPTNTAETNDADNDTDQGTAGAMLDRATYGQTLDPENDGQRQADLMDDSMRSDMQPSPGPAPASDENIPSQLTDPSDRAFTLPEEQV